MKCIIATTLVLILVACSKKSDTTGGADALNKLQIDSVKSDTLNHDDYLKIESYQVEDKADTSLCYTVDHDCAIIISPTDKQIDEMIKTDGEDDFATMADDMSYYQSMAMQMIDSVGIKTESFEKQYVKFIGDKKSWTLDARKRDMPAWNIILFKKNKDPEIISAIDLTTRHVKDYFDK